MAEDFQVYSCSSQFYFQEFCITISLQRVIKYSSCTWKGEETSNHLVTQSFSVTHSTQTSVGSYYDQMKSISPISVLSMLPYSTTL